MRFLLMLLICALSLPAHAKSPQPVSSVRASDHFGFGAEMMTLKNGLQVVVIPNHRVPVVTHMVWYKVGGADEAMGQSGSAHYLEHLMFKGTHTQAPGEFSKTVKTLGGNDNAFTGHDYTAYFQSISVEHLEKLMAMEADRMTGLSPPESHFESEKKVVIEERRQRTDNDPRNVFGEQMHSALFVNHPYGRPIIGWMDEMNRYQWADIKKFYDTWYAPNNAVVVISGDVTLDSIRDMVKRTYGALPLKPVPTRARPTVPPANGITSLTLRDKSVEQPSVEMLMIAPSFRQNKKEALALQLLENIMDGGAATRLYKNLVVDQKKAVTVNFGYQGMAYDYGFLSLSATPAEGVALDDLVQLLQNQFREVISSGITQQELDEAVSRLQDSAIFARDSVAGPAMLFGQALTTGSSVADVENWHRDIDKITIDDIIHVAKTYTNPDQFYIRPPVIGYLLPLEETQESTP